MTEPERHIGIGTPGPMSGQAKLPEPTVECQGLKFELDSVTSFGEAISTGRGPRLPAPS